jgi:hypothetical protein
MAKELNHASQSRACPDGDLFVEAGYALVENPI